MPRELLEINLKDLDHEEFAVRMDQEDDAFLELVASVRRDGILQPILAARRGDRFVVVAGHRRTRAALACGLVSIPAQIECEGEGLGWRGSWAENLCRKDLSPMEEAAALSDGLEKGGQDFSSLARMVGRSHEWVEGRLAMMHWPDDCQQAVHVGILAVGAVRSLAMITDETHRRMLLDYAVENGASARTCVAWYQAWKMGQVLENPADVDVPAGGPGAPPIEPYTPCVLCGEQFKMIALSFSPVCHECGPILLEVAAQLRAGGDGKDVGPS